MSGTILVTGATGKTGRKLVTLLADHGVAVRAAVRSAEKAERLARPQVETVIVDGSERSWQEAANGVDKVFVLTPFIEDQEEAARPIIDAAVGARVKQIVKLSAIGTGAVSISILRQHRAAEERIEASGIPFTHLRPNFFMENLFNYAGTIKSIGSFFQPTGETRVSYIDTRDVAAVAAAVLTQPGHEGKTYTPTGAESLSHSDIAGIMTEVLGRPVNYVAVPEEVFRANLENVGMPGWMVGSVMDLMAVQSKGLAAPVTTAVRDITGREPIRMEQFIREHAEAFTA